MKVARTELNRATHFRNRFLEMPESPLDISDRFDHLGVIVLATGQSSPVLLTSPNADQTNSLRSTRSLANLLAACVNDPDVTASLFDLTPPPGGVPPDNTVEALANLARDPGRQ